MKKILFSIIFCISLSGQTQHLIDPSFEDTTTLFTSYFLEQWFIPTWGSSDSYCLSFHTPNDAAPFPPYQYKVPVEGDCFVGLLMMTETTPDKREYVETKLISPLVQGREYCVSMYVVGSTNCNYSVNGFSVGFREDSTYQQTGGVMEVDTFYRFTNEVIKDTLNWRKLSLKFIAKGNEQYLSIGQHSMQEDVLVDSFSATGPPLYLLPYAYYFFDMITLEECPPEPVEHFLVYPNPSSGGSVYLSNYADTVATVTLYNSLGQRVAERMLPAGANGLVAFEGLASGVYIAVYQTATGYREEKKVVVL